MITAVFVYGTLMPGQPRWGHLAPYAAGEPVRDQVAGRLVDTGCGYPGLVDLGAAATAHGWVVTLEGARLAAALERLDEIEGTQVGLYVREVVATLGGRTCWTYRYLRATDDLTELPGSWA